jgi:hypothetical protein
MDFVENSFSFALALFAALVMQTQILGQSCRINRLSDRGDNR